LENLKTQNTCQREIIKVEKMPKGLLLVQFLLAFIFIHTSGRNRHGHSYSEMRETHYRDGMQYIVHLGISEEDVCSLGELVVTSLTSVHSHSHSHSHSAPPHICLKETAAFLQPYSSVFGSMEECHQKLEAICSVSSISSSKVLLFCLLLFLFKV